MLIESDKTTHGLLSGGCLEADVAEHALAVFADGQARRLDYDLSDDSVFGLGAGCDGSIHIVLQLLKEDCLPLSALNPEPGAAKPAALYLSDHHDALGEFAINLNGQWIESAPRVRDRFEPDDAIHYVPPPKVAVVGAGSDVVPLTQGLSALYWHGHVLDHRPGLLTASRFPQPLTRQRCDASQFAECLNLLQPDAVVLMTHNLNRDATALAAAVACQIPYIGLLGPVSRRDKVLDMAGLTLADVNAQLHAPVGLKLGGRLPENIALSILAELQQHFFTGS